MNNSIMIHEIKSSVAKSEDDLVFILDLLANSDNQGILFDLIKSCGPDTSLGIAIFDLISKLAQARKNVIPEVDNLINIIESMVSTMENNNPPSGTVQ